MSESITEQEQIRRLGVYRSLVQRILWRKGLFWLIAFVFFTVVLGILVLWRTSRSMKRYTASVKIVHHPSSTKMIPATSHDDVALLFARHYMRQEFRSELLMRHLQRNDSAPSIEIKQDRKQRQLFTITCSSRVESDAISGANLFWDLCHREYTNYRLGEIQKMREILDTRKRGAERDLERVIAEERELRKSSGLVRPMESDHLLEVVSEERIKLSGVLVKLASVERQIVLLKEQLAKYKPQVSKYCRKLRSYLRDIRALEADLRSEEQLYTTSNPRYIAKVSQLDDLKTDYANFLKDHELVPVDEETLDHIERMNRELKSYAAEAAVHQEAKQALVDGIDRNEKLIEKMREYISHFKELESRHQSLAKSIYSLVDATNHIDYVEASINNDLVGVELAEGAEVLPLVSKVNVFVTLLGSAFLTFVLAFVVVIFEIRYGKVYDFEELMLYPELGPLGAVPDSEKYSIATEEDQVVLETIFYHSEQLAKEKVVLLVIPMQGAVLNERLQMAYEWKIALSGRRVFRITIVKASTFTPPDRSEQMAIVSRRSTHGYLPLENVFAFASSERELFLNDLTELKKDYDTIVIERHEPLRLRGVFLGQVLSLCDTCFLMVSERKTPRSAIRDLVDVKRKEHYSFLSVMTGSALAKASNKGVL